MQVEVKKGEAKGSTVLGAGIRLFVTSLALAILPCILPTSANAADEFDLQGLWHKPLHATFAVGLWCFLYMGCVLFMVFEFLPDRLFKNRTTFQLGAGGVLTAAVTAVTVSLLCALLFADWHVWWMMRPVWLAVAFFIAGVLIMIVSLSLLSNMSFCGFFAAAAPWFFSSALLLVIGWFFALSYLRIFSTAVPDFWNQGAYVLLIKYWTWSAPRAGKSMCLPLCALCLRVRAVVPAKPSCSPMTVRDVFVVCRPAAAGPAVRVARGGGLHVVGQGLLDVRGLRGAAAALVRLVRVLHGPGASFASTSIACFVCELAQTSHVLRDRL